MIFYKYLIILYSYYLLCHPTPLPDLSGNSLGRRGRPALAVHSLIIKRLVSAWTCDASTGSFRASVPHFVQDGRCQDDVDRYSIKPKKRFFSSQNPFISAIRTSFFSKTSNFDKSRPMISRDFFIL